jgi:hypothetical protein
VFSKTRWPASAAFSKARAAAPAADAEPGAKLFALPALSAAFDPNPFPREAKFILDPRTKFPLLPLVADALSTSVISELIKFPLIMQSNTINLKTDWMYFQRYLGRISTGGCRKGSQLEIMVR